MARTLALLVVVVCFVAGVLGQNSCPQLDGCQEQFQLQAKNIGHDHAEFCELQRQELICAETKYPSCPPETKAFAQTVIDRLRYDQENTCGCSAVFASTLLLCLCAVISLVFKTS